MIASDFDSYRRDLSALANEDLLDVFRRSPVLVALLQVIIDQAQELDDALVGSLWARTIDGATGAQLDVLGRIVGVYPRPTQDAGAVVYFAPDLPLAAVDWAPVYVTGAPLAGQVPLNDVDYRTALRVKIAKNHVKYGSAPELQYFARIAWGATISVRNLGLSELEVTIAPNTAPRVVTGILSERTDETADHQYALPIPTTCRIVRAVFREQNAFAPDVLQGAPDVAPIGVSYHV